jgi:hypothetical protein
MKNLLFVFFAVTIVFTSCKDENKSELEISKGRVNMLLPTSIPVNNLIVFETSGELNWQKEFNSTDFIKKAFSKVLSSEVATYFPFSDDSTKCIKEDILTAMGAKAEPLNLSEIKSMYFDEEWSIDTTEPFLFEKKILSWYPVRYFKREGSDKEEMKLIFKVKGGDAQEILAKNIKTEFQLQDTIQPTWTENLNSPKLVSLILSKVFSGKTKVWDPSNIEKELTRQEIDMNFGVTTDTIYLDNPETGKQEVKIIKREINPEEISSIIFVEDWYYDSNTLAIKKVITGIGPVRHYVKSDGEMAKKVVFMMYLGNEKTKIF